MVSRGRATEQKQPQAKQTAPSRTSRPRNQKGHKAPNYKKNPDQTQNPYNGSNSSQQTTEHRPVGSNYRLGGTHNFFTDWGGGGAHIFFFKMTELCNEQYSIFVQIIGGARPPPCPPLFLRPWNNRRTARERTAAQVAGGLNALWHKTTDSASTKTAKPA